jgi:hypothetical protein
VATTHGDRAEQVELRRVGDEWRLDQDFFAGAG